MKASDKMKINSCVASGLIKRNGELYVLFPWAFPSRGEYDALIRIMQEHYDFSVTEDGVVAVPKAE